MPFQTAVNPVPAPGISGDFASTNPRHVYLGGPGGLVAGPAGVACGYFGWVDTAEGRVVNNFGAGKPSGFVHNAHQALITTYLGETSLVIPGGFMVGDLFDGGDFWCLNPTGNPVTPGQKVYVNNGTGAVALFGATGSPPTGGTSTASTVAAETFSITASAATPVNGQTTGPGTVPAVMTVTAVGSGTVQPGSVISGTGVASGTTVVAQLSGTPGGIGTYSLSIPQAFASTTVSGTWGLLTIGGTVAAGYNVGDTLSGATGTITANAANGVGLTGTGGAGTYATQTQTVASGVIDSYSGTESDWYAASFGTGAANEVIKITTKFP